MDHPHISASRFLWHSFLWYFDRRIWKADFIAKMFILISSSEVGCFFHMHGGRERHVFLLPLNLKSSALKIDINLNNLTQLTGVETDFSTFFFAHYKVMRKKIFFSGLCHNRKNFSLFLSNIQECKHEIMKNG